MTTKEIYNQLTSAFAAIDENHVAVTKRQSEYDAIEQDLLHFLEFEKCDAITMMRVVKRLKNLRIERRKNKIELDQLNSIKSTIHKNKVHLNDIERFEHKTYTYRTDVMKDLMKKN